MTERGRRVLEKVVGRIGEISPSGLGHWTPAWDTIAEPSDQFLDALRLWEGDDSRSTRAELQAKADAFVRVWRNAAQRWAETEQHDSGHVAQLAMGDVR